ncbi:MAG TPA: lasso peptide biosynthesis PqqD family chaperone [Bacillales bacterium]|nr:lasso peptide biosynthesis PqqD family chaperone [Bacillales bacterium]
MTTNQKFSLNQEVVQGKNNIVSEMGEEKVMLSIENGKYYNLGEIGGEIWDLMQEPIKGDQVVSILMSKYDVEQTECEEHVISFLNQLNEESLIEIVANAMQWSTN